MMKLRITHETSYDYTPAVETGQHMTCLIPIDTTRQKVLSYQLNVSPEPAQLGDLTDVYGNHRTFFSLQLPHETLQVTAVSEVLTEPPPSASSSIPWEDVREHFRYRAEASYDPAVEFVFASSHIPLDEAFISYAEPSFTPHTPLIHAARDLMSRIHHDFTYASESTEISTPTLEALAQRQGVCQDFAHIMIACLRSLGLAARYVSGYLLTQPPPGQPRLIGADASHAWVSVYLPDLPGALEGQGWYDLDPTNNRDGWGTPGEDYVTVATGRDYSDISPIRGVIYGGADHTLDVAVTVTPFEQDLQTAPPA